MEDWLRYAPPESLSQFMYQKPSQAKRLYLDVIPKYVDEYLTHVSKYPAAVCNTEDKSTLWHFISRYRPDATPENAPTLDRLTEYAIEYFRDFVKPYKQYRTPTNIERMALLDLVETLSALPLDMEAEGIQTQIYEVGKRHAFKDLKSWFKTLYETLLGQPTGPRMGSFIALYGIDETVNLIRRVLDGESLEAD